APPAEFAEGEIEDNSDVIAAAMDRIRAKAHEEGHRFKPYVRSKSRREAGPKAAQELAEQMGLAVALLRERRFEEAIEPLLRSIARDDENRTSWILLGEAYLRVDRPYKAAVAYLRSLELSPKDEPAWCGVGPRARDADPSRSCRHLGRARARPVVDAKVAPGSPKPRTGTRAPPGSPR